MRARFLLASLIVAGLTLLLSLPTAADEAPSKEQIDKLIDQLGSGSFAEREKATRELAGIGIPALDALRKASKSDDAEVRKRIEDILPKIERQAESDRVLAPKRVKLVFKDTPLSEAVADIQKKSGYSVELHDPDGKLKERKITLDTGETSFWHAFGLFCEKAEVSEASFEELMQMAQAPGGNAANRPVAQPVIVRPGRAFVGMPGMVGRNSQLILKDGKPKSLPTDDQSAVRIRALGKTDQFGNVPDGEVILALDVSLEPKLQWQNFQSIHVEKVVDDQDQKLAQVIPQVEGAGGAAAGNPGIRIPMPPMGGIKLQQQIQMQRMMRQNMLNGRMQMGWSGLSQQVPVQIKKGAKEAKTLKELQGVLAAQVLTEARPVITTDNLDKATGKTFKGDEGGSIKIVDVKAEENQTTIQLEFEQPPYDKVVPGQPNVLPGAGLPQAPPRLGGKIAPPPGPPAGKAAPPPVQQPAVKNPPAANAFIRMGGGGPMQLLDSMSGLSVQDDKANALALDGGRSHVSVSFVQQGNGPAKQALTWTLICMHDKDKGKPAKVVYLGRKSVTVEIPFALKDVPLP